MPCGAGSATLWPLWSPGREIPSFCILWISVVRVNPSLAAAPFGPPITQRTASSVCRIRVRSESRSVVAPREIVRGLVSFCGGQRIGKHTIVGKDYGTFDQVLQFADIPRPLV